MSKPINSLYIIGSLRNENIPRTANTIRNETGIEVFDDWFAAGPEADDWWQQYENGRGHDYVQALDNWAARNTFNFDRTHLNRVDATLLVLPAGKSGHLELGYSIGIGKRGFILLDGDPERFDVMYLFAERVFRNLDEFNTFLVENNGVETFD